MPPPRDSRLGQSNLSNCVFVYIQIGEAAYSTNLRLKMQEAEHMVRCIVPSRERSLTLTKLDEALFWANAAIAAEGVMNHEE